MLGLIIFLSTSDYAFASIPLVLGNVPGSEFRRGIAIVFIGGLISSLFLTLLLIPTVYMAVVSIRERVFRRLAKPRKVNTKTETITGIAEPATVTINSVDK